MQALSSQSSLLTSKPKSFKLNAESPSNGFFKATKYSKKIKPIRLLCKKIGYEGDVKQIQKISVKGEKFISRVAASGEYTIDILNKIRKTSCLKMVRSMNFDPYLCDISGLKALSLVIKKFARLLFNINLTFRRVTEKNEVKQFSLFLARLNNMTRLKIDISNQSGIDAKDFKDLMQGCKNFASLKVADVRIGGSKDVSQSSHRVRDMFRSSSSKLEKIKHHVYFSHTQPAVLGPSPGGIRRKQRKPKFFPDLKSMSLKFAFKTGWASYFDGNELGLGLQAYFQRMPKLANPIHLSLEFDKIQVHANVLKELSHVLPQLSNLRFFNIELNSIKLAEFELIILAKGFVDSKQIEHITFKFLDSVTIPMSDIFSFILIMAQHSSCPRFDLFFRKLFYQEWQTPEANRKLEELQNIKGVSYVLTKRLIHIQKFQSVEGFE